MLIYCLLYILISNLFDLRFCFALNGSIHQIKRLKKIETNIEDENKNEYFCTDANMQSNKTIGIGFYSVWEKHK